MHYESQEHYDYCMGVEAEAEMEAQAEQDYQYHLFQEKNNQFMELTILTAPLSPQEVEWRVQSQTKDGQKIIIVPYITNRCVMQRFDDQFGWAGWQNKIEEIDGGFLCTITAVLPGGEIVTKTDGASRTGIEPIKGGISDSMKRAAVQFGLGRALYDFPKVLIQTTDKYIPDWANPLLDKLIDKINAGGTVRDVVVLKPEHAKQS